MTKSESLLQTINEIALATARQYVKELEQEFKPFVKKFAVAGSIRRKKEEPGDIDLVVIPKDIMGLLNKIRELDPIAGKGQKFVSFTYKNVKVQMSIADAKTFGSIMLWATGPSWSDYCYGGHAVTFVGFDDETNINKAVDILKKEFPKFFINPKAKSMSLKDKFYISLSIDEPEIEI